MYLAHRLWRHRALDIPSVHAHSYRPPGSQSESPGCRFSSFEEAATFKHSPKGPTGHNINKFAWLQIVATWVDFWAII